MPSKQYSFLKFIQESLLNRMSYLSDKLYSVSPSALLPVAAKPGFRPILILARQHYREELVWYPITKLADVKKLVQLKLASQTVPVLVSFGAVVNNQTPVSYFYPQLALDSYRAWFIVPETLLLGAELPVGALASYQSLSGNTVFVARTPAAIVSSLQGGVLKHADQFAIAHGLNADETATHLELQQAIQPKLSVLAALPWFGLRNKFALAKQGDHKKLIRYLSGSVFVATLYLLASYQWSAYLLENSRAELQHASAKANELLTERESVQQLKQRYQQLAAYMPKQRNEMLLWQLLAPLYENKVVLTALEQKGDDVRIEILAPSATEALQLLLKQPQVVNAGFDSPVRRRNDQDEAGIKFTVKTVKEG